MTQTSPASTKSTKWPTFLALNADIVVDEPISMDYTHTFDAAVYDQNDHLHKGTIGMWVTQSITSAADMSTPRFGCPSAPSWTCEADHQSSVMRIPVRRKGKAKML
ncbi:hypothetical protein CF319_g6143 [Tilletia indica]|nr:hypothetical protein CF319_g6143 [Tilletia indica]